MVGIELQVVDKIVKANQVFAPSIGCGRREIGFCGLRVFLESTGDMDELYAEMFGDFLGELLAEKKVR